MPRSGAIQGTYSMVSMGMSFFDSAPGPDLAHTVWVRRVEM